MPIQLPDLLSPRTKQAGVPFFTSAFLNLLSDEALELLAGPGGPSADELRAKAAEGIREFERRLARVRPIPEIVFRLWQISIKAAIRCAEETERIAREARSADRPRADRITRAVHGSPRLAHHCSLPIQS